VRLQGETVTERDWREFDAWLTASPANAHAYDAVLAFDQRLDLDARAGRASPRRPLTSKVVRLRPARRAWIWSAGRRSPPPSSPARSCCPTADLMGARETTYATSVGERRTIALEDGSRIEMNAASRLTVRFERNARRPDWATPRPSSTWPRIPAPVPDRGGRHPGAGGRHAFDVRRRDGQVAVNVQRGWSRCGPICPKAPRRSDCGRGRGFPTTRAAPMTRASTVAVDEVAGWRQGRLIYRDQPLSRIVGDMNRLFPRPVKLGDAGPPTCDFPAC
jgi:transmembrane sensor